MRMRAITSFYLILFFLIGMYACTPENNDYPKKYIYTSYSVSSGEMFAKESDLTLEELDGRETFIEGKSDTFKLILDSFIIGQSNFIKSFKFLDENLIRYEVVSDFGRVVDSLATYFTNNSFIYGPIADSTHYVIGFKESEEHIVKDYAAIYVKPALNSNNQSQYYGYSFDDLDDMTMSEYLSNLNEEGQIYIGDTVISIKFSFNYVIE